MTWDTTGKTAREESAKETHHMAHFMGTEKVEHRVISENYLIDRQFQYTVQNLESIMPESHLIYIQASTTVLSLEQKVLASVQMQRRTL